MEFPQMQIVCQPRVSTDNIPRLVPKAVAKKRAKAGGEYSVSALPGCHQKARASRSANQPVETYSSGKTFIDFDRLRTLTYRLDTCLGGFDWECPHCNAHLLRSEHDMITSRRRVSKCCGNGAVHTKFMRARYSELMNPPDFMKVGF